MKKKLSGITAVLLAALTVISAAGCAKSSNQSSTQQSSGTSFSSDSDTKDLLDGVALDENINGQIDDAKVDPLYTDFAVKLAQNADKAGENLLISPISAAYGLTLIANGAHGDTLTEFENTLGGSTYTMNRYFYFAMEAQYANDDSKFTIGNSLWINNDQGYDPDKEYLTEVRTFFDASLFLADFSKAQGNVNTWLKDKKMTFGTNHLFSENDSLYSVNSLDYMAKWKTPFNAEKTKKDKFTGIDGAQSEVEFFSGTAERMLKDDKAQGFAKSFDAENFAMAVIMPNEGVSVEDYLKSMTCESLIKLFTGAEEKNVGVTMPKLEQSSDLDLKEAITAMGIKSAFDSEKADFSVMGKADKNLYLSGFVADTEIRMSETALNSSINTSKKSTEIKTDTQINVNRPFIYMIYDLKTNIPKYIGAYKG